MKQILFLFLIFAPLLSNYCYAQSSDFTEITKSDMFPVEKIYGINEIFQLSTGEIVSVKDEGEFLEVIHFNEDLSIESISDPIKFTYNQEIAKNYFKKTYLTKEDKIIFTFVQKFKKKKKIVIWANILDLEAVELEYSKPIKLTEINYKEQFDDYHISFNEERSQFVFTYYQSVKDPKERNIISNKIFNSELDLLWEEQIDEITVFSAPAGLFRIANNGKVVVVIPIKDETVKRLNKSQQKALFLVYIYDMDGKIEMKKSLKMNPNTFLRDFNIKIDNNKLFAGGLYSKDQESTLAAGAINFTVDLENVEETDYHLNDFSIDLITENNSKLNKGQILKSKKKGDPYGISFLTVKDIISHTDGYYVIYKKSWVSAYGSTAIGHYQKDYVVFSFSNEDELIWVKIVPMSLKSSLKNYYSENIILKEDNLYFIYFDAELNFNNPENIKRDYRDYVAKHLSIRKLDSDGNIEGELIFNTLDLNYTKGYVPSNMKVQNTKNSTIILFWGDETALFLKVDIEE